MIVHNYTKAHRYWGHDFSLVHTPDNGKTWAITGHGDGVKQGDWMLIQTSEEDVSLYRLDGVDYFRDPSDMFSATMSHHQGKLHEFSNAVFTDEINDAESAIKFLNGLPSRIEWTPESNGRETKGDV